MNLEQTSETPETKSEVEETKAPPSQEFGSLISLERKPNGLAVLTLDSLDQGAVVLSETLIEELDHMLGSLEKDPPKGLIITGPREDMFSVGADITAIRDIKSSSEGTFLAEKGQKVFNRLEKLPFRTVAVISGPCVGGGLELSLACDLRICSDHKSTIIGLPEVKLGILPGFGGCQRLPRLIGLPKALDIILAGKTLRPKQALQAGVVSEIVATQHLMTRAESVAIGKAALKNKVLPLKEKLLMTTSVGRYFVRTTAEKQLARKTKGRYPAPPAALETVLYGLEHGVTEGLKKEAEWIGKLLMTPVSQALVRIFFLTEQAKGLGKAASEDVADIHGIIVGAGVMGRGIAETMARKHLTVALKDINREALKTAQKEIEAGVEKSKYLSPSEQRSIMDRVSYTAEDSYAVGSSNIVIEAVVEKMDLKKQILSDMASKLPVEAIIASNTSSLSIDEMAEAIDKPGRFIGMHFFNPVRKMPLVELIRGKQTSEKTIVITAALAKKLGKVPIVVENVPGFLVNRILYPYLNAAAFLLSQGCSPRAIDDAAQQFGMPMGPLRLLDEVGHDVAVHVSSIMHEGYGERMKPFSFSEKLLEEGSLGKKSGKGIYDFSGEKPQLRADLKEVLGIEETQGQNFSNQKIEEVLTMSLIQEAVRCLDEGVAGKPGKGAAGQIDLATVMGIGFPPFLGGVLHYAESLGADTIKQKLEEIRKLNKPLFEIPKGIKKRAEKNKSFYETV